jgi:hypothetical protein
MISAENNKIQIYSFFNNIYVVSDTFADLKGEIKVCNLSGKVLFHSALNSTRINKIHLENKPGYYLVRVRVNNTLYTEKVFLKKKPGIS